MIKTFLGAASAAILSLTLLAPAAYAAPPAAAFGELPVAKDGAISPDGTRVAAIVNNGGNYYVVSKSLANPAEKPWTLPVGEKVYPGSIVWANDDMFLLSISRDGKYAGTPYTQTFLFAANVKTQEADVLVKPKGYFRQFNDRIVSLLDDDPEHILMAYANETFDSFPDVKKVNLKTGKESVFMKAKDGIEYWRADDEGRPMIGWGRSESRNEIRMIIRDPNDDSWDSIKKFPGLTDETPIYGVLKDGRELVIGAYEGKDTLGAYVYDLDQRKITRKIFHDDKYDTNGVVLSKDGEEVLGARYTADTDKTELLPQYQTAMSQLRAKFANYDVDLVDQDDDGSRLLVRISGPSEPGGLFLFDEGDPNPQQLSVMYNGLQSPQMGKVIATSYAARDGQTIPAYVTLPVGMASMAQAKNIPFIVLPHGGPYGRDAKRFDWYAQFFATRGYGVLQMNFRGSEGYGKSFADAGRDNWVVMQEDVQDGTRWLYNQGYADKSKTCIAGWSYGGYAALMGAAKDTEGKYNCVLAMAALTDIDKARSDLLRYRGNKKAADEFFGEALSSGKVRDANSPTKVAQNIKVPVFLAHAEGDQNVQFEQFELMQKALKKARVKGTYLTWEDDDHFLSKQANRQEFVVEMEKFLNKVNGPSPYMK